MAQKLLALCHIKNELNRKRRRFYYHMWNPSPKFMTKTYARNGYRKAQQDMKAMTAEMKAMRKECGAKFIWSDYGAIEAVRWSDRTVTHKHFKKYYEMEMLEVIMFSETER